MVTANLVSSPSHGLGYTCLAFSRDGTHAFTGGQDCVVRIWKTDEGAEHEPETAGDADGGVTSLTTGDDCWISGSGDAEVRRYLKKSNKMSDHVASGGALAIRCVSVDPRSKKVAVASDDLIVKIVDLDDIMGITQLKGHTSPIRKITWHPSGTLLTVCSFDGKIYVWNLSKSEPVLEKTIEGVIPVVLDAESPDFSHDCSALWHPSGEHFYVVSKGHDVVVISRSTWSKTATFSDRDAGGVVTALAVSSNGAYLASASQKRIHVWSTETRKMVVMHDLRSATVVDQLAFSPTSNLVAWTDEGGIFTRWIKPISDNLPSPFAAGVGLSVGDRQGEREANDMDVDQEKDVLDDDDWIDDDLGGGLLDYPAPVEAKGSEGKKYKEQIREMVSITVAQAPFQPGATPFYQKKRYLAYNLLGVIEVTDQEDHNVVNVEFFDQSTRRGFHFTDDRKCDIGHLGERGALFASPPEDGLPARVLYRPYGTWATQNDWTYSLLPGTTVLGVAAGGLPPKVKLRTDADSDLEGAGHVVIATSEGDLTFLSGTGRERRIMGLGADFISMVAGPEWVFVVHRAGSTTIDGSQNLSYSLISFDDFSVLQHGILPLPKQHTLSWIGITDQGAPATYDTTGRLHILTKFRVPHHASWARILDTNLLERRQGKVEFYWPVGVAGSTFMCLILKGGYEYPTFPRPLVQELPIRMPFRRDDPKEELIERELLFIQMALDALDDELTTDDITSRERAIDKEFIQLIQQACKADNTSRALELTKLLHSTNSLDAAAKIAAFYHLPGFKEKVLRLKADREENEDRLVVARDKRRQWLQNELPPRRLPTMNDPWPGSGPSSSRAYDPLGDDRPPPVVHRPGMARVTRGVVEESRYTSQNIQRIQQKSSPDLSSSQTTIVPFSPLTPAPAPFATSEGKRKRDEDEELRDDYEEAPPAPSKKPNPFARKPAAETGRNPFARKPDLQSKMIQKSESFFDKVDAAEHDPPKGGKKPSMKGKEKEKSEKKEGPKQATLLGMMSGTGANEAKKPRTKSKLGESIDVDESQAGDIPMANADVSTAGTSTHLDTQPWDESQTALEETQLVEG